MNECSTTPQRKNKSSIGFHYEIEKANLSVVFTFCVFFN